MIIVGCPGQGSQTEGFLASWLDEVPDFAQELNKLSEACDLDLLRLGTTATEDEIKDTAIAQPLIVGASIAAFRASFSQVNIQGVVGHSVGEFAAAAISGVLSDTDAISLVKIRGQAMARAAETSETSMAAILGGEMPEIEAKLEQLGLTIANFNGPGQVVAAGPSHAIKLLMEAPPERARVIELKVAGAFHTNFMTPAREELNQACKEIRANDPEMLLWSNSNGALVSSGESFLESLVEQVASPVRWDKCMQSLPADPFSFVELPPAGALAGMVKRNVPSATALALKTPVDFEKVVA